MLAGNGQGWREETGQGMFAFFLFFFFFFVSCTLLLTTAFASVLIWDCAQSAHQTAPEWRTQPSAVIAAPWALLQASWHTQLPALHLGGGVFQESWLQPCLKSLRR